MASIEQRIEHLFPNRKGKDFRPIVVVASLFAERRGQWLKHADVIRLVNEKFANSTVLKAYKRLSCPLDSLNGHSFIDTESIKKVGRGGPIVRGRLSDAASEKLFSLVQPVYQEPTSCLTWQDRTIIPPLQIGDKYLLPEDIINRRNQKYGEEDTRRLLNKMSNDVPGANKKAVQKMIEKLAEQQGIEFNPETIKVGSEFQEGQFTKDGRIVFPDGDLEHLYFEWKKFHGEDKPYMKADDVLKAHHFGPIPLHQYTFTDVSMRKLATDDNRTAVSAYMNLVDSNQDDARVFVLEDRAMKGDQGAFDELMQVLSSDDSKYARQGAAHSLGLLYDTRAIELLVKAMLRDESIEVRAAAVTTLGGFGYRQEFTMALKDCDSHVREEAAAILGKIGDKRAVEPLKEALKDSEINVQGAAADALGLIGDIRALDSLIPMLDCKNESCRCSAALALGNIVDTRAIQALRKACNDPWLWVCEAAKKGLEELEKKDLASLRG